MANWYVSSVKFATIAQWAASTAYSVGDYRRRLTGETSGALRVFKCTTAGTSGGTEPAWNTSDGNNTNDGTVVWQQIGGREAEQAAGNWKAALGAIASACSVASDGDVIYVSHDHAESWAAGVTMNKSVIAVCANSAGANLPPVSADLANTASVTTTGSNAISIASGFSAYGVNFRSGVGGTSSASNISISGTAYFENCEFELGSTSTIGAVDIGASTIGNGYVEWNNTRLKLQNSFQRVSCAFSEFLWRDSPGFLTGVTPSGLISWSTTNGARAPVTLRNMDLSALTVIGSISNAGYLIAENCKIHASLTLPTTSFWGVNNPLRLHNCDPGTSGNIGFNVVERSPEFVMLTDPTIHRTGGASDGSNSYSLRFTMNSGAESLSRRSRYLMRINKRYNTTGVSKTFTVHALVFATTMPTRSRLYGEFFISETSNTPVPTKKSTQADFLDNSAPATSTADWTAGLSARTNSTFISAGALFKVASNPNRVFYVTTSGTTAASEPGAYASAVDGGTLTDGTAVIKVLNRIKFEVTATPARAATVTFRPHFMAPINSIIWIDPKIEVS